LKIQTQKANYKTITSFIKKNIKYSINQKMILDIIYCNQIMS